MTGRGAPPRAHRLRVVHVIETLAVGGAEVLIAEALPRLAAAGYDVRLRAVALPDTLRPLLSGGGVDASSLTSETGPTKRAVVQASIRLRRELACQPADLVHTHLFNASLVARAAVASLRPRPRLITSLHNPDYRGFALEGIAPWKERLHALVDWASTVSANDALVAVSRAVADDYSARFGGSGPFGRQEVIYNAIDVRRHVAAADALDARAERAGWGFQPEQFVIASVGRLTFQKNYDLLIDAVIALRAAGVDAHAIVLGAGPEADALIRRAPAAVRFVGKQPRERVLSALAACDVYAQPSRYEAFGIAVLEAMASARPVVATSVDGIKEVVADGQTGRLVPTEDLSALVAALGELAAKADLRTQFGEGGRQRAYTRFDLSEWVSRTDDLYRRICRSK